MKEILKNTEITVEFSFISNDEKNDIVKNLLQAFEIPEENVVRSEFDPDRVVSIKCDANTFQTMFAALTVEAQRIADNIQNSLQNAIKTACNFPAKETTQEILSLDTYVWLLDDFRKAENKCSLLRFKLARNLFHGEEVKNVQ